MDFGKLIKTTREEQRKSLACVSRLAGIPSTTINSYERGYRPTLERADRLLKALGISLTIGIDRNMDVIPLRLEEYSDKMLLEELLRRQDDEQPM